MKRTGVLVRKKYLEYLFSTMAFTLSIYVAAIVDGILLGKLIDAEAFTAVNLTMTIVYVKNIMFCLFISGGTTLAAQMLGARRFDACGRIFTLSLLGGVLFSVLMAFLGIATAPWQAAVLAGGGEFTSLVREYLVPLWALAPFVMLANGSAAFMRLEGRHRLAAAVPILANVVNLLCDLLYVGVFGWGIRGAGYATITGYAVASLLVLVWFRSRERTLRFVRPDGGSAALLMDIFRVGLPISLIDACDMLRYFTINLTMLSHLGAAGGQIISVCNAAMLYAAMVADGASTSMGTVVGALYGERDKNGMLHVMKTALALTAGLCLVIFSLIELFPAAFAGLYEVNDPGVLSVLNPWLRLYCLAIPVIAPLYILRGFYQSTGQENAATALSVLEGAVFMVPVFYLFSRLSVMLMACAYLVAVVLSLLCVVLWMQRKAEKEGMKSFLMLGAPDVRNTWESSIPCTEEDAVMASRQIMDFCNENGLSSMLTKAVGVSVEELCVNIARYAGLKPTDQIDLFLRILDDSVVFKVRDGGRIFNPTEYMESGELITGLKLIRALSSSIEYDQIIGFNTTIVTCGR